MARDTLEPAAGGSVNSGSDVVVLFCTASAAPDSIVGEADSVRELVSTLSPSEASISEALVLVVVRVVSEADEGGEVRSKDTTVWVS
jgi:hypothetical protein